MPGLLPGVQEFSGRDRKLAGLAAELAGGSIEKQRTHFGADQPDRGAADRDRIAARGEAFRRADVGLSRHEPHLLEGEIEFLGGDLSERGEDALPDLDFAGENLDPAVGAKFQPLRQTPIGAETPG